MGLIGQIAAPIAGGLIGQAESSDDINSAKGLQNQALQNIQNLPTPELQKAAFDKYVSAGVLSPEMESTINQQNSQMANIQTDPRLQSAQMGALSKLQSLGNGGLQPQDLAALSQAQRTSDQDVQAKQDQILQDMQQRGQGGSGNELVAKLMGAQQGADRLNQQSMDMTGQASQRALQSLMQAGQLGTQIQGQSFNQQAQQAAAQDAINKFNAANSQQVQAQNVNRGNYGQQYNLQNLQNIMNQNTGLSNQQQMYNNQLMQQDYNNKLQKNQAIAGQSNINANSNYNNAANTQAMYSGLGQGVGSAFSAVPSGGSKSGPTSGAGVLAGGQGEAMPGLENSAALA